MRAICNVCNNKDSCSYLKRGKEGDCIDVQTSDYGYEEAVEKAVEYMREHIDERLIIYHEVTWSNLDELINDFEKAMEI